MYVSMSPGAPARDRLQEGPRRQGQDAQPPLHHAPRPPGHLQRGQSDVIMMA